MDMSVQSFLQTNGKTGRATRGSRHGMAGMSLRRYVADHYERLHRRLANHLGSPDLAGDCLQDTWLKLGDMALPDNIAFPEAYVYRVACNVALDRWRSERTAVSLIGLAAEADMPDPAPRPDQVAEGRSVLGALERALAGLPFRHRQILVELRVHERTRTHVAATYGVSLRTVDTILQQSLDHCAAQMGRPGRRRHCGVR